MTHLEHIWQAFRRYIVLEDDKDELASFILGQMVKERMRLYQAQHYAQPEKVSIQVSEFEERVSVLGSFRIMGCIDANRP